MSWAPLLLTAFNLSQRLSSQHIQACPMVEKTLKQFFSINLPPLPNTLTFSPQQLEASGRSFLENQS